MITSDYEKGAMNMRDNILAHIIGLQSKLGNQESDKGYQALQDLADLVENQYGMMFSDLKGF